MSTGEECNLYFDAEDVRKLELWLRIRLLHVSSGWSAMFMGACWTRTNAGSSRTSNPHASFLSNLVVRLLLDVTVKGLAIHH
jgi:hypothetical protein